MNVRARQPSDSPADQKNPAQSVEHEPQSDQLEGLAPDHPPLHDETQPRRRRGFATMDRKRVCEIAAIGGKAAHAAGTAHHFSSDEARVAGRKGGRAVQAKRRVGLGAEADVPSAPAGAGRGGADK